MNIGTSSVKQDLFDLEVAEFPDTVALVCDDEQLTYGELDRRVNQLAHHLCNLGIQSEELVGICTARSLDMVVGILAILKAGGAYVPLDPSYPKERFSFILDDAQISIVLTQSEYRSLFPEQSVNIVCMDQDWDEIAKQPDSALIRTISPEDLAYVIYTSGSTGKPKGVMITHSSLSNFVRLAGSALDVTRSDLYLQTASIAYALSVRQLMIPLATGATVVLANSEQMHDPLMLFQLIKQKGITLMDMVPSFWRTCIHRLAELSEEERHSLLDNSLRRIVSIGEALGSDVPYDWVVRFGHKARLVNIFGQTETTGVVATYPIPNNISPRAGIVPIGRSIPETKLYILDSKLQQVAEGEQGELCVSNPCLARGYLNRCDLTAEKFIPNPFQDGLSSRLYRTGDLARRREDGVIEFLGRGDYQVKIRGQRLELGEVESVIRTHEWVRDCVVTARGDHPDEKYLAAYVVLADKNLTSNLLRDFIRNRLPDYMVPSTFVFMDALPLTPNGKINRLALPDPSIITPVAREFDLSETPRNHIEQTIANIWKNLLKLDHVGIHDNYFDLGGHSLMSVRMFARVERDLGVRLPYTTLFHATTIAQIAELVANVDEEATQWKIVVPIQPHGDKPPFFGVHGHEGGVLFWRDIVSHLPKDQPFYALQAVGVDGIQTPLNSIPATAELYISEIRKVQPHGPYYIGGYSMGGEIAFEMGQQLVSQNEAVNLLVMFDTRNPKRSIRPMTRTQDGSITPSLDAPLPSNRFDVLKRKLVGHYFRLSALSPGQQISYILHQIQIRIKRTTISALVKIHRSLGRRIPDYLLLRYLRESHSMAKTNYVPMIYPGKITLFRASQTLQADPDDSPLGWGPLAAGGVDIYHFESSHEIVNAEHAKDVALRLNDCLTTARGG